MTLMAAGVACLTVSVLWHACLAVASAREAARWAAGAPASGPARAGDGGAAAPSVLWLVLVNPTPVTLAAVRAVGLRLRCRTRAVLVVSDLSQHERPEPGDMHRLVVSPRWERAEVLNRAYRLIRARCRDYGEDPARTVVGVLDAGAVPDEDLAVAVWRAFAEPRVGAVQARVRVVGAGALAAAERYERGVLADAVNLVWSRWGAARLGVTGAFVRLSELSRLGPRPWRPGVAEDYGLGVRLRRLGVLVRHCPGVRVSTFDSHRGSVLRRYTRAALGRWLAWRPWAGPRLRWERLSWAGHVVGWPLRGLVVLWVLAAFGAAAGRLGVAASEPAADAPWWSALVWTALAMDTPSWAALGQAAAVWAGVAVAPVVVWWVARRDLVVGDLVRGALGRPLLLAARAVAFGLALGRWLTGRRMADPVGAPIAPSRVTGRAGAREKPVFVDTTGRRRRRLWTVAYGTSVVGLAYVVMFGFALAGGHVAPHGGVGDRPRVAYPMPTPAPLPQPTTVERPARNGGAVAGSFDPQPAAEPAPPVQPSPTAEPVPSAVSPTGDLPLAEDAPVAEEPAPSEEAAPVDEPVPSDEASPTDEPPATPEAPDAPPSTPDTDPTPTSDPPPPDETVEDGDGEGDGVTPAGQS